MARRNILRDVGNGCLKLSAGHKQDNGSLCCAGSTYRSMRASACSVRCCLALGFLPRSRHVQTIFAQVRVSCGNEMLWPMRGAQQHVCYPSARSDGEAAWAVL